MVLHLDIKRSIGLNVFIFTRCRNVRRLCCGEVMVIDEIHGGDPRLPDSVFLAMQHSPTMPMMHQTGC